jgi:succinate---hydroxymethylglutarate CoA-transferase
LAHALTSSKLAGLANITSNYLIAGLEGKRYGTAHPSVVPYQALPCKDGFIIIGAGNNKQVCTGIITYSVPAMIDPPQQFEILCRILNLPELSTDPRFSSNSLRVQNRDVLINILSDRLVKENKDVWLKKLVGAGVPYGPINNIKQTFEHPQVI